MVVQIGTFRGRGWFTEAVGEEFEVLGPFANSAAERFGEGHGALAPDEPHFELVFFWDVGQAGHALGAVGEGWDAAS